jgi:hypothetical protein
VKSIGKKESLPICWLVGTNLVISVDNGRHRGILEARELGLLRSAVQQLKELRVAVDEVMDVKCRRALDGSRDRLLEEALRVTVIQHHLRRDGKATSRLPHERDVPWVAAKGSDVLLHPLEGHAVVEKTSIGRGHVWMGHETESAETVTDVDGDEVLTLADPVAEVIVGRSAILQGASL